MALFRTVECKFLSLIWRERWELQEKVGPQSHGLNVRSQRRRVVHRREVKFPLKLGPEGVKRVTAGDHLIQDSQKMFGTNLFRLYQRFA